MKPFERPRPNTHRRQSLLAFFALGVALLCFRPVHAQELVEIGSTAYIDYYYNASSPDEPLEGLHGFTFRRLYLTTDFDLSEAFSARARLEASNGLLSSKGPSPFVKDLWVRWQSDAGHTATMGVTPPPVFDVTEDVWGYRSLEKTLLDLFDISDSRDFGLRLHGPVTAGGRVRYAAMYANNSGTLPEIDEGKRLYGQLLFAPSDALVLAVGGSIAGYVDERDRGTVVSGLAGYTSSSFRVGLETFWNRIVLEAEAAPDEDIAGASLFAIVRLTGRWEAVGRLDRVQSDSGAAESSPTHVVAGLSFIAHENIRLIPNLIYHDVEGEGEPLVQPRFTLELDI